MKRVALGAWLLVVWLALWGPVSVANVASGLVVAAGVQLLPDPHPVGGRFSLRPLAAVRFVGYFVYKLVEANVFVARQVLGRGRAFRTSLVEVPLQGASDSLITVVASAIGLMPGSVTVETRRAPAALVVHALHPGGARAVWWDVRRLEVMAVRAFGSPEALEALEHDGSTGPPEDDGPPEGTG